MRLETVSLCIKNISKLITRLIPDKHYIFLKYFISTGRVLNYKNPQRYTEKLQLYKLFWRDELMTVCSDKYEVRSYVGSIGLADILNDLYGVWATADDIEFETLPNQFALKANHASGTNFFVTNKAAINYSSLRLKADKWLKKDSFYAGREWGYKNIRPKIIAEKLLPRDSKGDLPDYKFFCFAGKVFWLYCMVDYTDDHSNGKLGFFDRDFKNIGVYREDFKPLKEQLEKPLNFDKMIEIAEKLSSPFPHVRVDLYNIDGEIVFGEMTFYNACGYFKFTPDKFDFVMGAEFNLPSNLSS